MTYGLDQDYSIYKSRRKQIINYLKKENLDLEIGVIALFADFEEERYVFRQESSFYYLTGVAEPGAILLMFLDGRQLLYLPNYGGIRECWTNNKVKIDKNVEHLSKELGFDQIKYLGKAVNSYSFSPVFLEEKYFYFLKDLEDAFSTKCKKNFFTLLDIKNSSTYFMQLQIFKNLLDFFPALENITKDFAPLIHFMRRLKDNYEIDLIYKAVQITSMAHEAAASVIVPGRFENEVQAIVESVFTQAGASRPAFPSIVATGLNTTVLHYTDRDRELCPNDLVVVDIGAEYKYYASDLTRTFPVTGRFTKEQLEIYEIVLNTQKHIESIAMPGMFINNKNIPEKSLNHLAKIFLQKYGFSDYFIHGIGHYLGLDVHDVGEYSYPLEVGDVFTIEPGIYIPNKKMGIRIEDDYIMTEDGAVCISFGLPRKAEEIEKLMKHNDFNNL